MKRQSHFECIRFERNHFKQQSFQLMQKEMHSFNNPYFVGIKFVSCLKRLYLMPIKKHRKMILLCTGIFFTLGTRKYHKLFHNSYYLYIDISVSDIWILHKLGVILLIAMKDILNEVSNTCKSIP